MKQEIFTVVSQGDVSYVPSQKVEGGQLAKCVIRLKVFGGSRSGNEYLCTMLGNCAQCRFVVGEYVVASLRFSVHEVNGVCYQDILVNDIIKINS